MATVALQIVQTLADSGAPADQATNVMHFDGGTDYASIGTNILNVFAGSPLQPSVPSFGLYTDRTKLEVKVYDLADPKPRPERYYEAMTMEGDSEYGPRLLAPVLSFYSGRNIGRQRGRLFIGPVADTVTANEQVPPNVMTQLINLAKGIYATDGGTWNHVVYSQANHAPTPTITNYFVSNSWGVQHSRALAASGRSSWAPS